MNSMLTGRSNALRLYSINTDEISVKWKNSFSIDVGEEFRKLGSLEYWHCETTGFRWYTPMEAAGGLELYVQLEKFDWYYKREKWEFSAALSLISKNESILEVGVGEGYFLQSAKKDNFTNLVGVELNPRAAGRARQLGFTVHELPLKHLSEVNPERFDVICSFQVLEHVPDPREFLEGMIGMLRPGGRLILSVPNAQVMRWIDPACQDLLNSPPHHMGHWDEQCFRALEKILPLEVQSVHREPLAGNHVKWIMTGYLRSLFSPLGVLIPRLLFNRYTLLPFELLLRAGLGRFFYGHTLLVEIVYKPIR
jgi:2-polyprenyl-3-methyl-5-hydroxy-6-metoxy-1,4-benzoquinol methylase